MGSKERVVTFEELMNIDDEVVTMEFGTQNTAESVLGIILHKVHCVDKPL